LPFLTTNMHQGIEPAAKGAPLPDEKRSLGAPAYGATGVEQIGGKLAGHHLNTRREFCLAPSSLFS
jgi:hypothetical protein